MNFSYPISNVPYGVLIPWDIAWPSYYWVFYVLVTLASCSCILNCFALLILLSPDSGAIVESREARILVIALVLSDFAGSMASLVSSVGSLATGQWFGEYLGCRVFSFLVLFLGWTTLSTLDLMAFHLLMRVTNFKKQVLPLAQIYAFILLTDVLMATIVSIYPGDSRLYASGSACIPKVDSPTFILFMVAYTFMMSMIVVAYVRIYLFYKRITTRNRTSERISDKKRRLPIAVEVVCIWATEQYVPPEVTIWVTFSFYLQNVMNPLVYFYSNEVAIRTLKYKLGLTDTFPTKRNNTTTTTGTNEANE
eukprot:TRINITY_DN26950_c0_g1_i1.p1 TRINITY_DN26950_c0_g1~~TRINITY_DN26950_c0_g1_i1.p1  ORF type:complete len:330 (+),score=37.47 TRINITY_DN26950_c0_g1_i1:69-992(+)